MIDYIQDLQRIALTALFNPLFLFLLLLLFFAGRFFGKLTRRLNIWKILIVGYFAIFLFPAVRDAGPILGGLFLAGIASNHIGTFFSALAWAGNIGDVIFALKYRSAYEDIRRREQELDEREQHLRDEERRRAYSEQEQGQRARSGWQQEAKGFREKPNEKASRAGTKSEQKNKTGSKKQSQQQHRSYTQPSQDNVRDKHLQVLGLKPGTDYSREDIKKAYRRMAKKTHPDVGGLSADFIRIQKAWSTLSAV